MTQLLFQRFSQSIGGCARLNRWLSYCCGAHLCSISSSSFGDRTFQENLRFFQMRVSGSHHLFTTCGVVERINLQREGCKAEPYHELRVRNILAKDKLL